MGLFDIFKREETPQLSPPIVDDVLLKALIGSETITREKALTLPAVSGAVDFISNAVACMPVKLFKVKSGKVEEVEGDPRTKLLNCDTGDTLDAFQMKKAMVIDYLMGKGGYCYIRKRRNEVTGLFYVEDIYVSILRVPEPIYKDYSIEIMGKAYRPYEFIKLLRNTKDGGSGIGLTQEISKELETAYQTLIYQLGMVKSGGNKKGFLKSQRKLGQDEINVLKKAWANLYQNASENVVVLNNGLEFQEASNNSVEMQMNESKKTLRDEINDLFHIYPNDFERTFKEAIYPIVKAFETALNRDLLLEKEKKNYFFELDVKEIIRASLKERYESYKLAKETGFLTINEIRRQENLNWIEGLDVVNVGLGAVLYDVNEHVYYTPNTDTIGDPTDNSPADVPAEETTEELDSMLEGHELAEAYDESGNSAERAVRFNPNHGSDGKFAPTGGGGIGGGSNAEKIAQLKAEASGLSRFGEQGARRSELLKQIKQLEEQEALANSVETAQTASPAPVAPSIETGAKEELPVTPEKEKQFDIIQKNNAMTDDYHTGIRKPSDIKSPEEAFKTAVSADEDFLYPDFTQADAEKALASGKITIYSSKPIGEGGFVSPSAMMAQDYAGGGQVYSMTVNINDVAWIDSNEGQFAPVSGGGKS